MKKVNFNIESNYSQEVLASPTKDKFINMDFSQTKINVKSLTEDYVRKNKNLEFENLIIPKHNNFEIREISKLNELVGKDKGLSKADHILRTSTPLSQNIYQMLGTSRDSLENYAFVNKLYKDLDDMGIYMVNLSIFSVALNPDDDYCKQREVLFEVANAVNKIDERDLTPKYAGDELRSYFCKKKPTILLSVQNLGYDITEKEYISLPLTREKLSNDQIILTALDLGFNVQLLFKKEDVPLEVM